MTAQKNPSLLLLPQASGGIQNKAENPQNIWNF